MLINNIKSESQCGYVQKWICGLHLKKMNCWEFKSEFGVSTCTEKSLTVLGGKMGVKGTLPGTKIIYKIPWLMLALDQVLGALGHI
jgi:hypothetical protein